MSAKCNSDHSGKSNRHKPTGQGLGSALSLAYGIIEAYGGELKSGNEGG